VAEAPDAPDAEVPDAEVPEASGFRVRRASAPRCAGGRRDRVRVVVVMPHDSQGADSLHSSRPGELAG